MTVRPGISLSRIKLSVAVGSLVFALAGCAMNDAPVAADASSTNTMRSHTSVYDPMMDAGSGDTRPSAPSVNQVMPDQADGNGNLGIGVPEGAIGRR